MSGERKAIFFDAQLHRELRKIYLKALGVRVVSGLVSFLAVAAWVFLAVLLWTMATDEPVLWQAILVSRATFVLFALLAAFFVILPIARMPRFRRLALEVEHHKDFKHIVAAGYEFSERDDLGTRYSPELVREVVRQAVKSVVGLQVRFLFLNQRQLLFVPVAYAALVILIVVALVSPTVLFDTGRRIVSPKTASALTHKANLYGSPGDVTVLAGSDVEVVAFDFGGSKEPVALSYNLAEGFWKTEATEPSEVAVSNQASLTQYRYTFRDVRGSITYYFRAGDQQSRKYRINVVHKPIVTDMSVVLNPPKYTGEPADTLIDSGGNIQALEGTKITIHAQANNILSGAWVEFGSDKPRPVNFSGKTFEFDFFALEDGPYSILLEDDLQHRTDDPIVHSIEVYKDNPPVLDVLEPGEDATLPRNLLVDLRFVASDDYGISKASIFYRKNGEERFLRGSIPLGAERGTREIAKAFEWDLGDVPLFPGNFVEYFVQVEDNNVVTGPGVTKSQIFHIAVPTMAELYEKIKKEDAERTDLFADAMKETEEFKERLEKLTRELKKTEEMDWSQKKEIDKAISSQQSIEEKLEDIQTSLEETLQSLSDNRMTSQEIGEKLEEINRLIETINDEALNRYVEELREAMNKLDPQEVQKALQNLNVNAEDLLRSLERTESLLREIQQEQEMEELVRKARDLMDEQEGLQEQTSEADAGDNQEMGELSEEQKALAEKADRLAEEMKKMAENIDEKQLSEDMAAASGMCESGASKSMREASGQLRRGEKEEAMQSQEEAKNNLIALFSRVVTVQAQMNNASRRRTADNLQRLANSTLALSFKQEKLTSRLSEQASAEELSRVRLLANEQQTYVRAVEQISDELYEIGKKSVAVPDALLRLLGKTISNMRSSMLFLEQNKAFMATASASQAVTNLNATTIALLTACQQCQSGGGGGASDQVSRLQMLMVQQQQILQQSQTLLGMRALQEKMLQERQAAIERLAGEQRSLQQLAEDIEKDVKGNNRVLGRMDKIVEEMEEVIRDLNSGVLDEQTVRNQERIVSRLLDANRSVHSRDYEKKRLSVSADDVFSATDGTESRKSVSQSLREEIKRAMSLKAPGEFEDLIKLYFRALAEEAPTSPNKE
ncbi:MAG: hypothetical protein OEN01_00840 [Candidatus Krumholzibacteria bacterium]|nr:hypothetical protein [Candidatus Krumholzibacteria bacterium]